MGRFFPNLLRLSAYCKKSEFSTGKFFLSFKINLYICIRDLVNYLQNDLSIMQRKFTLLISFLFLGSLVSFAQSSSFGSATASAASGLLELNNDSWAFYADEENKVYYIDFESLNVNLSDISVRRKNGEVVMREDVFELPVNTIYEIDFNQFGAGQYDIELRSFTGVIRRSVSIQ